MKRIVISTIFAIMLTGLQGCTLIGIGVGAVAGSGTSVGMLGGAVIGGIIGHEIGQ
ncbi:MAG: prenyltransferase [Gallionellaceae bacterium]